jgi:hypothetical protein
MKSVLHEASSILKAIEKAWEASGKPSEFNVKVLEQGEKKFWVFTSRPSIVSISFDPRHVAKVQAPSNNRNRRPVNQNSNTNSTQDKLLSGTSPQLDSMSRNNPRGRNQQNSRQQGQSTPSRNQNSPQQRQQQNPVRSTQPQQQQPARQQQQIQHGSSNSELSSGWTPELAQFTTKELKGILHIMGITVPFQDKIDQKTLTITFSQAPLDNKEDARLLYISLSYLLIQLTKKQEKKKLRGFHLVITSN